MVPGDVFHCQCSPCCSEPATPPPASAILCHHARYTWTDSEHDAPRVDILKHQGIRAAQPSEGEQDKERPLSLLCYVNIAWSYVGFLSTVDKTNMDIHTYVCGNVFIYLG